jgi:hypothetical protein
MDATWGVYMPAAMAANPLAVNLASTAGINISWGTWALAGGAGRDRAACRVIQGWRTPSRCRTGGSW